MKSVAAEKDKSRVCGPGPVQPGMRARLCKCLRGLDANPPLLVVDLSDEELVSAGTRHYN